jgi:hypothetical protein
MPGFEIREKLFRWPHPAFFCVLQALTDSLPGIGMGRNVEQALIGFGILYDGRCFPLYGQHYGALGFLELFHEVTGPAAERRQRLDVVRDVKHGIAPIKAPF